LTYIDDSEEEEVIEKESYIDFNLKSPPISEWNSQDFEEGTSGFTYMRPELNGLH